MKSKHWKVKASRYVVKDQWLTVRSDDCETPDGTEVAPFYVFEYSDWVHITAFDRKGHVLLIRLYRHGNAEVNLELPGGTMDPSDTDPLETARRELLEETGYTSERFIHLTTMTPNSATHTNAAHSFLVLDAEKVADPKPDPSEDIECELVEVSELLRLIDEGTFRQALHIASIYHALRYLGRLELVQE